MKKYVVGITGGIASGKSAVSGILEKKGAYIIDADVVARDVVAPGSEGERLLKAAFPRAYEGGTLDRKVLREEVFSDKNKLNRLNGITHPLIRREIEKRIENAPSEIVFLVVPLLFESGFDNLCDYIATVVSDEDKRIIRLKKRNNNITEELAQEIIRAQLSENERITRSDEVIVNNESLEKLEVRVNGFYEKIQCRES